jgi:hypothetical protein
LRLICTKAGKNLGSYKLIRCLGGFEKFKYWEN